MSIYARTSVALTCLSATRCSFSTGISIPARQHQHYDGLMLPRSMFRGLLLFQVGCRACLKRKAGERNIWFGSTSVMLLAAS